MATQTVEFRSPPSQTITAKLFAVGSDTQVDSVSTTEATNRKGTYAAAYTNVPAGEYELIALVSTTPVARWFVTLTLTTATFQVYDKSQTVLMVADVVNASALAADAVAEIQSGLATPTNITAGTITTTTNLTNAATSGDLTATMKASVTAAVPTVASIQSGLATAANLLIVSDGVGYITSVLLGTISDAGTAGETYVITFGGATYTLDYTGLDSSGNRTGVTRTKV